MQYFVLRGELPKQNAIGHVIVGSSSLRRANHGVLRIVHPRLTGSVFGDPSSELCKLPWVSRGPS